MAAWVLLAIPRLSQAGTITCGQTVANATTAASENDAYTYTATAGELVAISLYGPLGQYSPYPHMNADVYAPGGQVVATVTSGNYNTGGELTLTFTNSGIYTIIVHANNYGATGGYSMSLQSVAGGGCDSTPIACGQTVSTNTSYNTEMDAYSCVGTAGQLLTIGLYGPINRYSPYQAMSADIYTPSGLLLSTAGSGNYNTGGALTVTLPDSGVYTILVHANNYNGVGAYSLSLQTLTGGGCNGTPIVCGQTVATNTSYNTEMDAYSYAGTAGQIVSFGLYGPINRYSPYQAFNADIYTPGGQLVSTVASGNFNTGGANTVTLPVSGVYTILVHANNLNGVGYYSMSLQTLTGGGCDSTPIACGQTVSTNTSYYSEMDAYSYAGTAGQLLAIGLYGPINRYSPYQAMNADIYAPSGQLVSTVASGNYNTGGAITVALPVSGVYTILVHANDWNGVGAYAMSLQALTGGGCDSTPIECGQTVNARTVQPTEMDAYGFVTSGGPVIFSVSGYSGARFDLYDSGGNDMLTVGPGAGPITNLAAGTYTFLVHDVNFAAAGDYGFTVTCLGLPCNPTIGPSGPIWIGATATNGRVLVTNGTGCDWTATANNSWLHIAGGSTGSGNGTVTYSADANPAASTRSGTMTIAGFTVILNQANPVTVVGHDIGVPGAVGNFSYTNGLYTVSGSGEGTDGTADVFYFLHEPLTGDGEIIARLLGNQGGDPALAEAGVMFRESLDPGAKQVSFTMNESTNMIFRRRLANDNGMVQNGFRGTNYLRGSDYVWLRLARMGDTFVAYCSTNGFNWQYMWFTTLTMSNQVQVGLEVTAHHYGQIATSVFDQVAAGSLTPLAGTWLLPDPLFLLGGQDWSPTELRRVGGFEFLLGGTKGNYFNIRASTNLSVPFILWPVVATVTNTYGVVPIIDAQSLTNGARYYRAQRLGP